LSLVTQCLYLSLVPHVTRLAPHIAGGPLGVVGLGMGGGCGVGLGLGWGYGAAYGAHYIVIKPEFEKTQPAWQKKLGSFAAGLPFPFPGKPGKAAQ
jgi:hypothetical protein